MKKIQITRGSRRIVLLVGKRAFKVPNFFRWVSFIRGIQENLEERYWWSADGSRKRNPKKEWDTKLPLAEIFWADRFGFLLIMERLDTSFILSKDEIKSEYLEKVDRDLDLLKHQCEGFSFYSDVAPRNVGYRGDRLLLLDYGFYGGTMDCYIGT